MQLLKYNEILAALESLHDDGTARKMSAYMRDRFRFLGVPTPARRSATKSFIKEARKDSHIDWELLGQCWESPYRECHYFVLDYLAAMQGALTFDDIPRLERLARTNQWWDSIDGLDRIIGNIGLKDKRIDDLMLTWSVDDDFWIRRIAIDHQLLRKSRTDTTLLERILVNNFGSSEFFINKAIGWSLREYSKTNPAWVREFIARHSGQMKALSIREASKYI